METYSKKFLQNISTIFLESPETELTIYCCAVASDNCNVVKGIGKRCHRKFCLGKRCQRQPSANQMCVRKGLIHA